MLNSFKKETKEKIFQMCFVNIKIYFWISLAGSRVDAQSFQDETTLDQASPQDTVDDDNRSSSSSQDLLQSMDEISSGSVSPDTTDRASPLESGIGTASPPRSTERRSIKRKSLLYCLSSFNSKFSNLNFAPLILSIFWREI